jgi:thiosulfate/3-mercaptopyruvate sulfurtransferase
MGKSIPTAELTQQLVDPAAVVVDVRPIAAYNGWRLQEEARGGHIPSAVACPLSWAAAMDADEFRALLAAKGITPDKTIVIYGYTAGDAVAAAKKLAELGYENVLTYDAGFATWAADPDLPLARLPRYEKLVHPEWVRRLISGEQPESYAGNGHALFHVNFGVPEEYAQEHIPGALYLDSNVLETDVTWNRRSPQELEAALLAHGISCDKTTVLYGRDSNPTMDLAHPGRNAGQIAAARAAAILMYAGVKDVRLLDGGLDSWLAAGYTTETKVRRPTPVTAFGTPIPSRPDYIIDLEEAKTLLADAGGELVSIRSWPEFIGDTSGYHYIGPVGRIAGAIWGNCGSDAYHMQNYRNVDNTMREYHEIEANWRSAGITGDKRIAFYCGTGWRASETFFYAYLLGWDRVAVYDGGWFEWSRDTANSIETGIPAGIAATPGKPAAPV